ncbi:diguanylate cyclase [Anaplasmataceae bacterium AB001_6]|nr:diguanylate cyclase [Anaplasmataceae bacterium AB001_6]
MTAKILVVDDNLKNLKFLRSSLESKYYKVFVVDNGQEALSLCVKEEVDLILLDIMMPKIDGFEVCKILKSSYSTFHIPIMFVTALDSLEDRLYGLSIGADDFLVKPIRLTQLFRRISLTLKLKMAYDDIRASMNSTVFIEHFRDKILFSTFKSIYKAKILVIFSVYETSVILQKNIQNHYGEVILVHYKDDNLHKFFYQEDIDLIFINMSFDHQLFDLCANLRSNKTLRKIPILIQIDDSQLFFKFPKEILINDYITYPYIYREIIARFNIHIRLKKYNDMLKNNVNRSIQNNYIDTLTGSHNREYLNFFMNNKFIKNNNIKPGYTAFAAVDIDFFKNINDLYGHLIGDCVLKIVVARIKSVLRYYDIIARIGGEEFIIILNDLDTNDSRKNFQGYLQRFLKVISDKPIVIKDVSITVTVSIGAKLFSNDTINNIEDVLQAVDKLLYEAKSAGRNRFIV